MEKNKKEKIKCWEFYNCNKVKCPAYKSKDFHCWLISGTYCRDKIQDKFYDKLEECVKCEVFISQINKEEFRKIVEKLTNTLHSLVTQIEEKEKDLELENIYLKEILAKEYAPDLVIGPNKRMEEIYDLITKVAVTDSTVLIMGETGTGKGLFARAIHYHSQRSKHPFVPINCSTLSENLLESELFGHVKGAFTNATADKPGLFELASNGTFFFDEIGDISLAIQGKILEVLQYRTIKRVGGIKTIKVDARIISATNKDIEALIKEGKVREDLFYRLNVFPIPLLPLREREDDIPVLANHFLKIFAQKMRKDIKGIHKDALKKLMKYDWPGNIRELENIIERSVILANKEFILPQELAISIQEKVNEAAKEKGRIKTLHEIEKEHILEILRFTSYKNVEAAKLLGIDRKSLYRKMKKIQE